MLNFRALGSLQNSLISAKPASLLIFRACIATMKTGQIFWVVLTFAAILTLACGSPLPNCSDEKCQVPLTLPLLSYRTSASRYRGSRGKLAGKSGFLQIIGNDNANNLFFSTTYLLIPAIFKPSYTSYTCI